MRCKDNTWSVSRGFDCGKFMRVVARCPYGNAPDEGVEAPWNVSAGTYGSIPFDGTLHAGSPAPVEIAAVDFPEVDAPGDYRQAAPGIEATPVPHKRERAPDAGESPQPPEKKAKIVDAPRGPSHSPTPPNSPARDRSVGGDAWEIPNDAQDADVPFPFPFASPDSATDDGYGSWDDGDDMPNIPILV